MVQINSDDSSWEDGAIMIDPASLETTSSSEQLQHVDHENLLEPEERHIEQRPSTDQHPPLVAAFPVVENPTAAAGVEVASTTAPKANSFESKAMAGSQSPPLAKTSSPPANNEVDDSTLDPNSILAQSIQNTLKFSNEKPAADSGENTRPTETPKDENPQNSTSSSNNDNETATTKKGDPGLWKLAGRKIKKYKVGKTILSGIKDGYDTTKKTLGIGVGHIVICVPTHQLYQPEGTVRGTINFDLTEPIAADALVLELKAFQQPTDLSGSMGSSSSRTRTSGTNRQGHRPSQQRPRQPTQVYRMEYGIAGKQEYATQSRFHFEVVIPRLRRQMSEETKNTLVGSMISSVQAISASLSSPVEWYLVANLIIPGRLNMSHKVRIQVAEEKY
mmetsp:Transcript_12930/g.35793  ORF Transcript_12930/g.35793 Transcript_12930/m.35793 type:complete len:390 (+) Transcript_12930:44-1213(+)